MCKSKHCIDIVGYQRTIDAQDKTIDRMAVEISKEQEDNKILTRDVRILFVVIIVLSVWLTLSLIF